MIIKINDELNFNKIQPIDYLIIGYFDGVHIGHLKLKKEVKNDNVGILTFKNIPNKSLNIYNYKNRIQNIKKDFDPKYIFVFDILKNNMSAKMFIEYFFNKISIKNIIVGSDFKFGNDFKDINFLIENVKSNVIVVNRNNKDVSTSKLKTYIKTSNFKLLNKYLNDPYYVCGKVIIGKQIAAKLLGFPTANIKINKNILLPNEGVFLTRTKVNNKFYNSLTFIGKSPTFKVKYRTVETHLININENINLYNKTIRVYFIKRIANVKKFNNINDLKKQIEKYVLEANNYFINN